MPARDHTSGAEQSGMQQYVLTGQFIFIPVRTRTHITSQSGQYWVNN